MEEPHYSIFIITHCVINESLYSFEYSTNVIKNLYMIIFFVIFNLKRGFILTGYFFNLYLFSKKVFYNRNR